MAILTRLGPQRSLASGTGPSHDTALPVALPNGTIASVIWREHAGQSTSIRLRLQDGQTHAPLGLTPLDLSETGVSALPIVTALANGHILVSWSSDFNPLTGRSVWAQEFGGTGQTVGGQVQISPVGVACELDAVTALPDGGYAVSWSQFTPGANATSTNWNVHARLVDASGSIGAAFRLNGANNGAESGSRIAVHEDGSFTAIWVKDMSTEKKLVLRTFDASGLPTSTERALAFGADSINDPMLLALKNGSTLVVWHEMLFPDNPEVMPTRSAHFVLLNAAGTEDLFTFAPDGTADIYSAKALQLRDGRLFLFWSELLWDESSGAQITRKAVFVTAEGAVSQVHILVPQMGSITADTAVSELADGRLAVSWQVADAFGTTDTALQIFDPREQGIALLAAQGAVSWMGTGFNDTLTGADAADHISGAGGADRLLGMAGNDLLQGGAGDDRLWGGRGDDTLLGGAGNDRILGGAGQDQMSGGAGDDTLWGHAGADQFVLLSAAGQDQIMDFADGEDVLDLRAFGFVSTADALAAFSSTPDGVLFSLGPVQAVIAGLTLTALDGTDLLI